MAITLVSASNGSSANSGSMTVTKPASLQANDIIIAFGASNQGAWTIPSGFTQFAVTSDASMANNFRMYGWWYKVTGSEGASFSFSSSTAASNGAPMVVSMVAWRGVDATSPILDSSVDAGGASGEPSNPATAFTQSGNGRLVFARSARSTAALPSFSTSTSGWTEQDEVADFSGTSVRYGIGHFSQTADTGTGNRVEPAVTCSVTETDNGYVLITLKAAVDPTTGTMDMSTPSLNNVGTVFAGTMTTPSGDITMSTPSLNNTGTVFDGIAAPPSGTLDVQLPSVNNASTVFAGNSIGGSFAMQVPSITSDYSAGVEPLGPIGITLPLLDVGFIVETTPFGGNVIKVEAEKRAFRVIDPDPGLMPILLKDVTPSAGGPANGELETELPLLSTAMVGTEIVPGSMASTTPSLQVGSIGSSATSSEDLVKYAANVGDGSSTSYTVTHNLGTRDVSVTVYDNTTFEELLPLTTHATVNTVSLTFAVAPALNAYRVLILAST